jgi:hypothetical protein
LGQKLLSLTFGRTTLAASAVVGGFLGGMGIGAWLYHLVQERVGRPLVIYAAIEVAIAIAAAGTRGVPGPGRALDACHGARSPGQPEDP